MVWLVVVSVVWPIGAWSLIYSIMGMCFFVTKRKGYQRKGYQRKGYQNKGYLMLFGYHLENGLLA